MRSVMRVDVPLNDFVQLTFGRFLAFTTSGGKWRKPPNNLSERRKRVLLENVTSGNKPRKPPNLAFTTRVANCENPRIWRLLPGSKLRKPPNYLSERRKHG